MAVMRRLLLVFFVLCVAVEQSKVLKVEADDGGAFVKTRGVQLILNGSPYYANGFNAYWLMYIASDPSQRNKVSSAFQQASNHGLNIARTWAFSDGGYNPLQYSPGSYNEQVFQVSLSLFQFHHNGLLIKFSDGKLLYFVSFRVFFSS